MDVLGLCSCAGGAVVGVEAGWVWHWGVREGVVMRMREESWGGGGGGKKYSIKDSSHGIGCAFCLLRQHFLTE